MYRARTIKKKTRNRNILLQNLRKGKARKEERCAFQLIPFPQKFICTSQMHYLHADVILMQRGDTFVTDLSLLNSFKIYKSLQVTTHSNQRVLKLKVESKNVEPVDWRVITEKIENSGSSELRQWIDPIKTYCERYEAVIQELKKEQREISNERLQQLTEINDKFEKTRENILKTYPCIEIKSQLKDDQIQITEISFSERYLAELGYCFDNFTSSVLQEGLPEITPLGSECAGVVAKLRLQKYLTMEQGGYQTPEFECEIIMKNGYVKKVKAKALYHTYYEKGVPGFILLGSIMSRQKPVLQNLHPLDGIRMNKNFIELMSDKEKETNDFLSAFYNQKVEQKYVDIDKVCKIKEVENKEELQ